MKIAFSTAGEDLDAAVDSRFGRCARFLIYDTEADTSELIDNVQNLNAVQGAGVQAAQNVARTGAKAVVTGHCGPKAFRVLGQAGIEIYTAENMTIRQALDKILAGELKPAEAADVEGHWV
ncbi:MAG: NifB/NifX family molybdenum-iron cluster-binding protein [Candidatus Sumerlaeia bacterium]